MASEALTVHRGSEYDLEVTSSTALMTISKAEIDVQVSTAHQYPRSIQQFRNKAMSYLTLDQQTALECFYTLPRGGKKIEGPSVRLAEIVQAAYGNIRVGGRIINIDDEFITAQGMCHDLENNSARQIEVRRRITRSDGTRYDTDMIGVTGNAAIAIACRNAVFQVVPKALWKPLYDRARDVARGDEKTLESTRTALLASFKTLKVTDKMICKLLGVGGVADIGLDHIVDLRGIWTAIKDGQTTVEELFASKKQIESEAAPVEKKERVVRKSEQKAEKDAEPKQESAPAAEEPEPRISAGIVRNIRALALDEKNMTEAELAQVIGNLGYEKLEDVPKSQQNKIFNAVADEPVRKR